MKKLYAFALVLALLVCMAAPSEAAIRRGDGRKTVTTGGTAEALAASETLFSELTICAETDNTGNITVGDSPVAALGTREGVPLAAGDCYTIGSVGGVLQDLQAIKIDCTVNGDGITYHYIMEEK